MPCPECSGFGGAHEAGCRLIAPPVKFTELRLTAYPGHPGGTPPRIVGETERIAPGAFDKVANKIVPLKDAEGRVIGTARVNKNGWIEGRIAIPFELSQPFEFRVERVFAQALPLCEQCGERLGTEKWGDALALTHGGTQMWCKVCVLEAQVAHAEERSLALPELRRRLTAAKNNSA